MMKDMSCLITYMNNTALPFYLRSYPAQNYIHKLVAIPPPFPHALLADVVQGVGRDRRRPGPLRWSMVKRHFTGVAQFVEAH